MNIRKQYVIFSCVILALVLLLVLSSTSEKRHKFNNDNVVINYSLDSDSETSNTQPELPVSSTDILPMGDFSGQELKEDSEDEVHSDDFSALPEDKTVTTSSDDDDYVLVLSDATQEELEQAQSSSPVDDADSTAEQITDGVVSPDMEQYASMAMYFVCNLDYDLLKSYLTSNLYEELGKHIDEEPYKALNGNMTFSDIEVDGNTFSFVAENGQKYSFEMAFEGERISRIAYKG